jgi:ketosteroid isomerase-like protein
MSQENVEIVLDQYAATNERDFERVMSHYADDVELVAREPWVQSGRFRGRETVGRWFGDWLSTFDRDASFDVTEARELPTVAVLIIAEHYARGRANGVEVHGTAVWVYRLREGKITRGEGFALNDDGLATRLEFYLDHQEADALEAAGLRD